MGGRPQRCLHLCTQHNCPPLMSDDRCGGHNHRRPLLKAINCFIRVHYNGGRAGSLSEMWSYVTPALLTLFDGRLALFIGTNWVGAHGISGPATTKGTHNFRCYQMVYVMRAMDSINWVCSPAFFMYSISNCLSLTNISITIIDLYSGKAFANNFF